MLTDRDSHAEYVTPACPNARLRSSVRDAVIVGGVTGLALVLRVQTALAPIETQDERWWMLRTSKFSDALHAGDPSDMSVALRGISFPQTMPGVTTMWVGTLARWVWGAGRELGLWSGSDPVEHGGGDTFETTRSGLQAAQVSMALATALLIGLLAYLVARWAGRWAGAVAGMLIATEPLAVAYGAVLHTDELVSLFGVGSLIATALVLGLPSSTEWAGRRRIAVAAGVLGGAAFLTKLSGLMFLVSAGVLGMWALLRAWRSNDDDNRNGLDLVRSTVRRAGLDVFGGWWAAGFVAVSLLAYPALWARPVDEIGHLSDSYQLAGQGHQQYFLGESVATPGPAYYLVAIPLRVTPWMLVATAVAATALWWRPRARGLAIALTCMALPAFGIISVASKQLDRYGLPLIMLAALAVGCAVASAVRSLKGRWASNVRGPLGRGALVALAGMLFVHSSVVSPWGLSYFNPLLGGSEKGEWALLVGWGEGSDEIGRLIADHAGGDCDEVTVAGAGWDSPLLGVPPTSDYRCGRAASSDEATYVVIHVNIRQRNPGLARGMAKDRERIATVRIRGIEHFRIYGPLPSPGCATDCPNLPL